MRVGIVAACLILFGAGYAQADPAAVQCPETLNDNQTAAVVGDWQILTTSATHTFSRLKVYHGNPQGNTALDPENAEEQPYNYRWTLGEAGDNLWVECAYHGATTRLIRQLPKGLHSCQAYKSDRTIELRCE